jgi:hypothetical protein
MHAKCHSGAGAEFGKVRGEIDLTLQPAQIIPGKLTAKKRGTASYC